MDANQLHIKNVVIIGDEEIGKTTLANALLGWDILPQTNDGWYIPTIENASQMLTESIQLTDTPGYDFWRKEVPDNTAEAVSRADSIVIMLSETLAEEDVDLPAVDPEWEKHRSAEAALLRHLLKNAKTRDIVFVIPYDTEEWPEGQVPLTQGLRLARERFSSMTVRGNEGFFCIDPMMALIGAIEADAEAIRKSGILPLKAALLGTEE